MGHLALTLFILAFALGASVSGLSFISYSQMRTPASKHFAWFLLAFNLLPLINYANLYLLTNFAVNSDSIEYLIFYQVLCFAGTAAKLSWMVFFVFFALSSFHHEIGNRLERWILFAALAATLAFTAAHAWAQFGSHAVPPHLIGAILDLATLLPLAWTVLLIRSKPTSGRKSTASRWLISVVVANLAVFCLMLASRILHYVGVLALESHLFASFLLTVPLNLVAFFFLRSKTRIGANTSEVAAIAVDFRLSKRETEIALLVWQGKTNREISKALFISLQTVKDHIYRIFRKTGARNRVELTNARRGAR